jgi:hypothetical protein
MALNALHLPLDGNQRVVQNATGVENSTTKSRAQWAVFATKVFYR